MVQNHVSGQHKDTSTIKEQLQTAASGLPVTANPSAKVEERTTPMQAERVLDWLRQFGFTYNPFQERNSERDSNLSEHFIEPPDFDRLLEVNNQAVFARIGDGKTATRLRLQSFYRDAFADQRIFAFSYLISQEFADTLPTTFLQHLDAILTAAVRHLFILLALRGVTLPILQTEQSALPLAWRLAAFFDHYYGLVDTWRADLQQAIALQSLEQAISNLAPVYDDLEAQVNVESVNGIWLQRWWHWLEAAGHQPPCDLPSTSLARWHYLCELLDQLGIRKIMLLVDNVDVKPDEHFFMDAHKGLHTSPQPEKPNDSKRMIAVAQPLFDACINHSLGDKVAWKLFLPLELYLPFLPYLSNQFFHAILAWDDKRLRMLLEFRLAAATGGVVSTLLQLAEEDVPDNLETYLIVQAGLSPRYLTHLINKILEAHVMQADSHELPGKLSGASLAQISYLSHSPI